MIDPPQSRESSKKNQLSWLLMAHQKLNRRYPARYDARRRHRVRHLSSSKMNQAAATTTTNSRRPRKTTTLHSTRLRKRQKRSAKDMSVPPAHRVWCCVCAHGADGLSPPAEERRGPVNVCGVTKVITMVSYSVGGVVSYVGALSCVVYGMHVCTDAKYWPSLSEVQMVEQRCNFWGAPISRQP